MSKVAAYYHIVFCTKNREMTIPANLKEDLYRFIWRQVKDLECVLIRIGGIGNHVHMLIDLNPSLSLATLVQKIKGLASTWMKVDPRFPDFKGWAAEYYASTIAPQNKHHLIEYIKNQEEHHKASDIDTEFADLYRRAALHYDTRDLK